MQLTKDARRQSRDLLRMSFADGRLDRERIAAVTASILASRPRNYMRILENYKRLLRLEIEKRHARIESATELPPDSAAEILNNLRSRYGQDLTSEFLVVPELLGGVRIRVGSDVWDSTVRNRLDRLAQTI